MVVSHKIHKSNRTLFWTAFGIFEDFTDHYSCVLVFVSTYGIEWVSLSNFSKMADFKYNETATSTSKNFYVSMSSTWDL